MYILSCSSLSCLVTDFMVIFPPCASYSELLNSSLAGFINALCPLPQPPCSSSCRHPPHVLSYSPLPLCSVSLTSHSSPFLLPPCSSVWSCGCLLLTGSVCLVLAGSPLSCLVAHCSSSWFKPRSIPALLLTFPLLSELFLFFVCVNCMLSISSLLSHILSL